MTDWEVLPDKTITVWDKMCPTSCRDPQQEGFKVGRAKVRTQSWGGSVKYQTCLIFCQSTPNKQGNYKTNPYQLCKHCSRPPKNPQLQTSQPQWNTPINCFQILGLCIQIKIFLRHLEHMLCYHCTFLINPNLYIT